MKPTYLRTGNDLRPFGGGGISRKNENSSLFWWTILITFMVGLATFCWFFSIMVFQHPEKPLNYQVLAKLDKLPVIRQFTVYTVPDGAAKTARDLLGSYYSYSPEQLQVANGILKRAYIKNYDRQDPPVYLTGQFHVLTVNQLSPEDAMQEGWVVRARAADLEDVDVEILMPGLASENPPFHEGDEITLDKRSTLAALVHVQKLENDRICCSVVPLVYGGFTSKAGEALALHPPRVLNIKASWPVTEDTGIETKVVVSDPAS